MKQLFVDESGRFSQSKIIVWLAFVGALITFFLPEANDTLVLGVLGIAVGLRANSKIQNRKEA